MENKRWYWQSLTTGKKWKYEGDVKADETGTINMKVDNDVTWTGAINNDNKAKEANIEVIGTWELTSDCYVHKLTKGNGAVINENGHKLTVKQ